MQSKLYIPWESTMVPGATTWSIDVNTDYVFWLTAILAGHFLLMNSLCRQHIHLHYKEYQQQCADGNITENEHAIP